MSKRLKHIPHIDGIRFMAAILVVLSHYFTELGYSSHFPIGAFGVQIFFAISGFLITGILLKQKNEVSLEYKKRVVVRNFFIKRALRLFPAYYVLIIVYIFLNHYGLSIAEGNWEPYFIAYMPNIFFYFNGWQCTVANHLWSLGIEEQFYLLWPFIILLLPRRQEFKIVLLLIILGYLTKCFIFYRNPALLPHGQYDPFLLPIGQFDTIGIGALLACIKEYELGLINKLKQVILWLLPVSLLSTLYLSFEKPQNDPFFCASLFFLSGALVFQANVGFGGFLKKIFDTPAIIYGGKISYGIYLFHKAIPLIFISVLRTLKITPEKNVVLISSVGLTLLVAHLSWKLFEQRINNYKLKFDI